jgi:hypothetical protein
MRNPIILLIASLGALFVAAPAAAEATTAGQITSYSTIYSIGIEWNLTGDGDHDATATVQYRPVGSSSWKSFLDLLRVDFAGYNMLAGSIMFLEPATAYEIKLDLTDPDGGNTSETVVVSTRVLPYKPVGGRTFHVVPGSGGGDGSEGDPFQGVAAADSEAQPGDTFLLHAGNYGDVDFDRDGTAGNYVVWQAAGDGEVTLGNADVGGDYVWVEGITVRDQDNGLTGGADNVVVSQCRFYNNHKSVLLSSGAEFWYIVDNVIEGDIPIEDIGDGAFGGEGIELNKTDGHTVAYNRISLTADGISYARQNVDIFRNDIFYTSDDGIEPDYGFNNIRMWENRVHFPTNNGISFQPMNGAPWYLIRNQVIIHTDEGPLKYKDTDRYVLLHNTLVNVEPGEFQNNEEHALNAWSRNNLFIAAADAHIWDTESDPVDWQTNMDYDGFDWGDFDGDPFVYQNDGLADVQAFAAATGQQANGIRVFKEACFETLDFEGPPPLLTLKAGCSAIDAGVVLPGINEDFAGEAPDLGAYERNGAPLQFGPREGGDDAPPPDPPQAPTNLRVE